MTDFDLLTRSSSRSWRLERRTQPSPFREIWLKVASIVVAILIFGVGFAVAGDSPVDLGSKAVESTLGTRFGREQLLILATPLLLTGAAFTLATRMLLFNVGVEGQLLIGAWAAAGVALHLDGPTALILPITVVAATGAAAGFALLPGWMRVNTGVSEILTTLLLNFVAFQWVIYFTEGPWRDPGPIASAAFITRRLPFELPYILGDVHVGIVLATVIVLFTSRALSSSVLGYEINSAGANRRAAGFAGMPVNRQMLAIMAASGALAGLAGAIEVVGVAHRLSTNVTNNYGWNGVIVAILAGGSFVRLIPYSLFMALLLNGGIVLKTQGVAASTVVALTGLILLLAAVGEVAARYSIVLNDPKGV